MAAEIKIHRGDQIGGCITEIYTKTTRILIDFGEDLPGSSYSERFHMDWGASADGKKPAVCGVFFTHYHGDHIGRFTEVPEHVQLCMSPLAREVLTNIHDALWDRARKLFDRYRREEDQREMEREEAIRSLLQNEDRVHTLPGRSLRQRGLYVFDPGGRQDHPSHRGLPGPWTGRGGRRSDAGGRPGLCPADANPHADY